MNSTLLDNISRIQKTFDTINSKRKVELDHLSTIIANHLDDYDTLDIVVICTHNSRRSQLGELWIEKAAEQYNVLGVKSYSGGTEATAFNHRMVKAVQDFGFDLSIINEETENIEYKLTPSILESKIYFSKVHDHNFNPKENYLALMVCDHASENCPLVFGMRYRIPLTYIDPKFSDDTPDESAVYRAKVEEIGREMLYLFEKVSNQI